MHRSFDLKSSIQSFLYQALNLPVLCYYDRLFQFLPLLLQRYALRLLRYEGELLSVKGRIVKGWAWCAYKPNLPIQVDIYNGNIRLVTITANLSDISKQGGGKHGFQYQLPTNSNFPLSVIRVKHAGTTVELKHHSPKLVGQHSQDMILTNVPWVHSPFFKSLLENKCQHDSEKELATKFHEEGYAIIEDVIDDETIQQVIQAIKPLFNSQIKDGPRSYYRVQDAWQDVPIVSNLAANQKVYDVLRFLYDREPLPFQTLNFKYGSQQRNHSDVIHFNSLPSQYMCGVWVALEDLHAENGPLFYYTGSHHEIGYTYYDMVLSVNSQKRSYEDFVEQLMQAKNYPRKELHVKKGSALVWAANLVHGGMPILKEGSTRWSQVTHYFFENCLYYSPRDSNPITGDYCLLHLKDVTTGKPLQHTYNGLPISFKNVANHRYKISF